MSGKSDYVRRQGQTRNHECHWPGCERQVPPAMWGCRQHWFKLPKRLRDRIWETYEIGQEVALTPSAEYLAVAHEVQAWIREHSYDALLAEADDLAVYRVNSALVHALAAALRESEERVARLREVDRRTLDVVAEVTVERDAARVEVEWMREQLREMAEAYEPVAADLAAAFRYIAAGRPTKRSET